MPDPALDRKKPNPSSTNQDESYGRDHQSQNPQQQNYGGIHSHQREHAREVVNSTQRNQPQQLPDQSPPPKQHPTPDKYPQGTTQPIYSSYGQTSQPPRYPSLPTPQQQPKQSNPSTPPRNDPPRTQGPQSINFTCLIYPPPQLPTQPLRNQISAEYKPPDEDAYSERNSADEVEDPETIHPGSYISTQKNQPLLPPSKQHPMPVKNTTQQYSTVAPLKDSPIYPPCGQIYVDPNKQKHAPPLPESPPPTHQTRPYNNMRPNEDTAQEQPTPKKPPPGYPCHEDKQKQQSPKKKGCCTIL